MAALGIDNEGTQKQCRDCGAIRPIREFKLVKGLANRSNCRRRECRFCMALKNSQQAGRKGGYIPCVATAIELGRVFTGFCHICGISELECIKGLCVDHSHKTGEFRGWLCGACNALLGMSKDSVELLEKAKEYLAEK